MKKVTLQLLIIVSLFFCSWLVLSKINWIAIFKVEKISETTEKKLGDIFLKIHLKNTKEIKVDSIKAPVNSIINKICLANKIDPKKIKLHIANHGEINAFALPNNHLIINSALILACETPEELSGIIAHEIAHMELRHVMKTLISEVGLTTLISITTGGVGSDKIKEIAKLISSKAYSRNLEKEADIKAVDYLIKTNIGTEGLSNFLFRLNDAKSSEQEYLNWISTHPDSEERSTYIIKYTGKRNTKKRSALPPDEWKKLKQNLSNNLTAIAQ